MNLREMIKKHEGLRLKPYKCPTGHWTVGFGHNLEAHNEPIPESITQKQAETYLDEDISAAVADCRLLVPEFDVLNEVRQAVLIDMCFNMGAGALAKFQRMLKWIKLGYWDQLAIEMLDSLWARQVPARATRLAGMMTTGEWA